MGRRRENDKNDERGGKNKRNAMVVVVVVWLYYSESCVEINVECGVDAGSMWWRVIQTKKITKKKRVSLPSPSLICTICAPNIIEPELGQ